MEGTCTFFVTVRKCADLRSRIEAISRDVRVMAVGEFKPNALIGENCY